jgi:hypothetical protein
VVIVVEVVPVNLRSTAGNLAFYDTTILDGGLSIS